MTDFLAGRRLIDHSPLPVLGLVVSDWPLADENTTFGQRLCVTGGREETDLGYVWSFLDTLHNMPESIGGNGPILELGAGCATGVDDLALRWAETNKVPWVAYVADWDRFGAPAGCLRNGAMLQHFEPQLLVVYDGGVGTRDCTKQARKMDIPREFYSKHSGDPFEEATRWG